MAGIPTIKRALETYFGPLVLLLITVLIGADIIIISFGLVGDNKIFVQIAVAGLITGLAVFAGIFIPEQIKQNIERRTDRRTLAFTLGLIWHELLYNEYILIETHSNLVVDDVYSFAGTPFLISISVLKTKIDSVFSVFNLLSADSFLASQNSGSIKTFNSDDLLNSVIETYQALKDAEYRMRILQGNATKNSNLVNVSAEPLDSESEDKIKEMIKHDVVGAKDKIVTALDKVKGTLNLIDQSLNRLGAKVEITQ